VALGQGNKFDPLHDLAVRDGGGKVGVGCELSFHAAIVGGMLKERYIRRI